MVSPISACDSVIRPPPPNPCSTRNAVSHSILGESAHSTEPTMKIASAMIIIGAPAEGVAEPAVDRRGDGVGDQIGDHHPGCALDLAQVDAMAGNAVATMVWSATARNIGSMIEGNTLRNSDRVVGGSPCGLGAALAPTTGSA